jgi:hypothetical protein
VTDKRTQIAKAIADVFSRGSYASAGDLFGLKASSLAAADAVLKVLDEAKPARPEAARGDDPSNAEEQAQIALGMVFAPGDWATEYLRLRAEAQQLHDRLTAAGITISDPGAPSPSL